jgi:hypothetical protein
MPMKIGIHAVVAARSTVVDGGPSPAMTVRAWLARQLLRLLAVA